MTQTAEEVRVGADAQIYVAPVSTAEPADVDAALDGAFSAALGYVTQDGIDVTDGKTVEPIGAMQSFYAVRNLVTAKEFSLMFTLMQWNRDQVELAFAGGTWTDQGGSKTKYTPPDPSVIAEYVIVADWQDGDINNRLVVPRVSNIDPVTIKLARTSAVLLPVKLSLLAPAAGADPWYILTDDPNVAS
jgi:hypothetical protein